jgi:Na+-driven multidrug efflux pump
MYRILEWGNITVISVLLGLLGKEYLSASQPSIQILCATNTLLQALAQATGVYISNLVGGNASMKRVRHSGLSGILNSVLLCLPITLLCFSIPRPLTIAFTHVDSHDDDFFDMAQTIFYINAAGLLTGEALRQAGAGALRGQKDINFAPIWSFIMMSVLGLTSGALLSNYFDEGVDWLFITRDIGLVLAGIMLITRWALKTKSEDFDDIEAQDEASALLPASINGSDGLIEQDHNTNYGSAVIAGVFANSVTVGSSGGENKPITQVMGHQ